MSNELQGPVRPNVNAMRPEATASDDDVALYDDTLLFVTSATRSSTI